MVNAKTYAEGQTAQDAWARTQKELQDYFIKEGLIDKGFIDETFKLIQVDRKRKRVEKNAIITHSVYEGLSTLCQMVGTAVTDGAGGSLAKSGSAPEFSSNLNDYYSIL